MRGFPKKLNSKFDYIYIKENFPDDKWKPAWKALLDEYKNWFFTENLASASDGITDDTHKVVVDKNEAGKDEFYQYELRVDPSSDMIRLGFTESEISEAVK